MRHVLLALILAASPVAAPAETAAEARARQPELFDPETGLRLSRYRAPTPEDVPGARVVDADGLIEAVAGGAALLDVALDGAGVFFGPDEGWAGSQPRQTIPGALWAPSAGRGRLEEGEEAYLDAALAHISPDGAARPVVVFCFSDCWMSWNAAIRIARRGWPDVYWYPLGADGWTESGGRLAEALPFVPPN